MDFVIFYSLGILTVTMIFLTTLIIVIYRLTKKIENIKNEISSLQHDYNYLNNLIGKVESNINERVNEKFNYMITVVDGRLAKRKNKK